MDLVWLDQPQSAEVERVGGKAASLGNLAAIHPVPPGFALTVEAYERWGIGATVVEVPEELKETIAEAQ